MKLLGASWRTSSAGGSAFMAAIAVMLHQLSFILDGDPSTVANIDAMVLAGAAICNGIGNWLSRDDQVTSAQAQARP